MEITKDKWESFIWVQKSGMYNMFDPNARALTELTKNEWLNIMENYSELETKYEGELQNEE
tara:strand:- start:497 stop:679 length:183 start_codon:yes stop_codon:yes gene_type:complete